MKANVYYIASGNKSGDVMNPKNEQFVKELSQKSGVEMSYTSLEEQRECFWKYLTSFQAPSSF